jgi:hypothetical protein
VGEREELMSDLKIRVFTGSETDPETTVTIPGGVLEVASKLIPKYAADALQERGINLTELVKLSKKPDVKGTLLIVEDHKKNEKIVIAIE